LIRIEKLDKKKAKIFEAYEEDLINKEEFFSRKEELNEKITRLLEEKEPYLVAVSDDTQQQIPYEVIKSILENFGMLLAKSENREEKKLLLQMIISEITINRLREIDSIKLKINDNLIDYITKQGGAPIKDASSIFALRKIGLSTIDFDIAI